MSDQNHQITILAENAMAGNRVSIEQLVDIFHQDIFRLVYYKTRTRMDAEDITQEIFIKMMKNLHRLKSPNKFKSWLFSIAYNHIRDYFRKQKMLGVFGLNAGVKDFNPEDQDTNNPDEDLLKKEFQDKLFEFIEDLSRWEKEIFILRFINHLKIREVAAVLKKNESTIKTHLYRAIEKLSRNNELRDLLTGDAG